MSFTKRSFAFLVSLIAIVTSLYFLSEHVMKEVKVNDGTKMIHVRTQAKTVSQVLEKSGVILNKGDTVVPIGSTPVSNGMEINIFKSGTAYVISDGKVHPVNTEALSVRKILEESQIKLGANDKVKPTLEYVFKDKTALRNIEVIRVEKVMRQAEEAMPFYTIIRIANNLKSGETQNVQTGENGTCRIDYAITYENGKEVSREIVKEEVLKAVKPEIIKRGADRYVVTSRGFPFRYKEVLIMRSTAYDLSIESCGKAPGTKGYGITYSGTQARKGVVAVDKRVIPLGTKLYVESTDGNHNYGFASAEDTGSAIRGNRIDLFFENRDEALQYGVREVRVYVMEDKVTEEMLQSSNE